MLSSAKWWSVHSRLRLAGLTRLTSQAVFRGGREEKGERRACVTPLSPPSRLSNPGQHPPVPMDTLGSKVGPVVDVVDVCHVLYNKHFLRDTQVTVFFVPPYMSHIALEFPI